MGAYRLPRLLIAAVVIGILMTCTQAWGTVYTVDKPVNEFGYIDQNNLDQFPGDWLGNVACAPTATMNSFVYLQNHYPGIYGNSLIPVGAGQDIIRARELALTWMGTTIAGTTIRDWTWGKYNYLENYAAGKTMFHGQTTYAGWTVGKPRPSWAEDMKPNWYFLYNQLFLCQDVEIGISWSSDMGHALTVTGLTWNDETNVGSISYIDPWDATLYAGIPMNYSFVDNMLHFNYGGNNSWIDVALAESAVPEPSAFLVLGSGFVGILIQLRRRRV